MKITDYLKNNLLFLDGSMGTLLQMNGLKAGELPERWNLSHPDIVTNIHRSYFDAGSNVVNTNTFGANILKYSYDELEEIVKAAVDNARRAAEASVGKQEKWVALDIGPTGRMLAPLGDLDFEKAVSIFAETVKLGVKYGCDLIMIETMIDSYETKAALLAAKENSELPVFVSNAYEKNGRLMSGASPAAMVALLEGMGADAIGCNCSFGPDALAPIIEEYLECASIPVLLKPNAGLPRQADGRTVYDVMPDDFAENVKSLIKKGVRVAGGCCGTTMEHIRALTQKCGGIEPIPLVKKNRAVVSSYKQTVVFEDTPILIGERINPTGKAELVEALACEDIDYIIDEAITQKEEGAQILDVNVGTPEIDEVETLKNVVCELQAIVDIPLQIDSSNPEAIEAAVRRYNGKALINSLNGKEESLNAILPIAKKYGGMIVALTLDENGIPSRAEDRLEIARKILARAESFGIGKENLIFDTLALPVGTNTASASETLRALKLIRDELGCRTMLGISNVSFGLPKRDLINSTFFVLAANNGLSAAIVNPGSNSMMQAYSTYLMLAGKDESCEGYIENVGK